MNDVMTTIPPYDLAHQEWTTAQGVQDLVDLWNTSADKLEAEAQVGGLLSMFAGEAKKLVDLGCGPGRYVPVAFQYLPKLTRYQGVDLSETMIAEALRDYGERAGVTFWVRSLFDGAPYQVRSRPDVLISIDTSRHYHDPMGLLRAVVENWPAKVYVFSVLYGTPAVLINGQVVSAQAMVAGLEECGEVLGYKDIRAGDEMTVRYVVLKGA